MQHEISARLLALLPPGTSMPAHGGWAVAADLLLYLVDTIRRHRPARIVELGSGTSTCWLAWALDVFDIPGTVVSLEHLPDFHRRTLDQLHTCGLQHRAEVRLAPLTDVFLDGTTYPGTTRRAGATYATSTCCWWTARRATLPRWPAIPPCHCWGQRWVTEP